MMSNPVFGDLLHVSPGDIVFEWLLKHHENDGCLSGLKYVDRLGYSVAKNIVLVRKYREIETPRRGDMQVFQFVKNNTGEEEFHAFIVDNVIWFEGAAKVHLRHFGRTD